MKKNIEKSIEIVQYLGVNIEIDNYWYCKTLHGDIENDTIIAKVFSMILILEPVLQKEQTRYWYWNHYWKSENSDIDIETNIENKTNMILKLKSILETR